MQLSQPQSRPYIRFISYGKMHFCKRLKTESFKNGIDKTSSNSNGNNFYLFCDYPFAYAQINLGKILSFPPPPVMG